MTLIPGKSHQLLVLLGLLCFNGAILQFVKVTNLIEKSNYLIINNPDSPKEGELRKAQFTVDSLRNRNQRLFVHGQFIADSINLKKEDNAGLLRLMAKYYADVDLIDINYSNLITKQKDLTMASLVYNETSMALIGSIHRNKKVFYFCFYFGAILFLIGIYDWIREEKWEKRLKYLSIKPALTYCQSCGKQFNSMVSFGKNLDGSDNCYFCSTCYQNGKFTNPQLSKADVKRAYWNALFIKYKKTEKQYNEDKKIKKSFDSALIEFDKKLSKLDRWLYIDY